MADNVWPITHVVSDAFMLLTVGLPSPFIKKMGYVVKPGFFCGDKDIMYPFKGTSPIRNIFLHPVGCILTICVVVIFEFLNRKPDDVNLKLWRFPIPLWIYKVYHILLHFAFGILTTILTCKILKGLVGRPRPYFLSSCRPNINCSLPENLNVYHNDYECTGTSYKINIWFSFPSGHVAFATFCSVFVAVYIEKRMKWDGSKLLKCVLQLCPILAAFYTGTSQISSFKHHCSDIYAGYGIGICFGILVCCRLYRHSGQIIVG